MSAVHVHPLVENQLERFEGFCQKHSQEFRVMKDVIVSLQWNDATKTEKKQ